MFKKTRALNLKKCPLCGHDIPALAAETHTSAHLCPECGFQTNPVRSAAPGLSDRRLRVILLAFFFSSFGVHKFYLKRPRQGMLYLMFCWTLVPALIGIAESFYYLSLSNEAFESKYGFFCQ